VQPSDFYSTFRTVTANPTKVKTRRNTLAMFPRLYPAF